MEQGRMQHLLQWDRRCRAAEALYTAAQASLARVQKRVTDLKSTWSKSLRPLEPPK